MSVYGAVQFVAACCGLVVVGCSGRAAREVSLPPGVEPAGLVNAKPADAVPPVDARPHYRAGAAADPKRADPTPPGERLPTGELTVAKYRADERGPLAANAKPGAKYDFLVLSGLGSRSLYAFGLLCGWSDSGTMPDFQVVTGVGCGAFGAVAVFAGPEYLAEVRRIFLAFDQRRILRGGTWDAKRFPHPLGVGTASVATTDKIRERTREVLTDAYFARVAAEHAKGRRLYVGTTNLDTQRFVVWDLGAIASEGTPESRKLFEDVVVASTAVPPLLDPSRIAVEIDGRRYDEMHVEGGITRALFWHPPSDWPGDAEDRKTGYRLLAGARVHVVLGNKLYNDPEATKPKLVDVSLRSMKAMLLAIHRGDLARLYAACQDRGMTMRLAAIPDDYRPIFHTDEFDPAKTAKLFCEGYTRARDGRAWDDRPPDRDASEDAPRRGTVFTARPTR